MGRRLEQSVIDVPILFVQAERDKALPPGLSQGMESFCPKLTRESVPTSHWALWEGAAHINRFIERWLKKIDRAKTSL